MLKGGGRPICAGLCTLFRCARLRVLDELHLWSASDGHGRAGLGRSEENMSELQSPMRTSYDVLCLRHTNIILLICNSNSSAFPSYYNDEHTSVLLSLLPSLSHT